MTTEIAKIMSGDLVWQTEKGEVQVTASILRDMFKAPNATDIEIYMFVELCKAQGLNPFTHEAYLVKYDKDQPASIVTGKETFTQRAEAHEQYDGMESGVILLRDGEVIRETGTFKLPTDQLVGGWSKIYRRDRSRHHEKTVAFAEYNTGRSSWRKMPGTMIEKVAIVQGLREAFPRTFAGLYDASEITETGEVVETTGSVVNDEPEALEAPAPPAPVNIEGLVKFLEGAVEKSEGDKCPIHGAVWGKNDTHQYIDDEAMDMVECKKSTVLALLSKAFQDAMRYHHPEDWRQGVDLVFQGGVWGDAETLHDKAKLALLVAQTGEIVENSGPVEPMEEEEPTDGDSDSDN